jgi:hypothetical protein
MTRLITAVPPVVQLWPDERNEKWHKHVLRKPIQHSNPRLTVGELNEGTDEGDDSTKRLRYRGAGAGGIVDRPMRWKGEQHERERDGYAITPRLFHDFQATAEPD